MWTYRSTIKVEFALYGPFKLIPNQNPRVFWTQQRCSLCFKFSFVTNCNELKNIVSLPSFLWVWVINNRILSSCALAWQFPESSELFHTKMMILFNVSRIYFYILPIDRYVIEPNYPGLIDIILLCNVWGGGCSEHKMASSHWITPVSLMASVWSQRVPADSQRWDENTLPRFGWGRILQAWQKGGCCHDSLVCKFLGVQETCGRTNQSISNPLLRFCPCLPCLPRCVWRWQQACQSKINTWGWTVCSLSRPSNPLCRAWVCFHSELGAVITFSTRVCAPSKAITVSPHHAAPSSSQTQLDRHINTPSHPIERSDQRQEGNPCECRGMRPLKGIRRSSFCEGEQSNVRPTAAALKHQNWSVTNAKLQPIIFN